MIQVEVRDNMSEGHLGTQQTSTGYLLIYFHTLIVTSLSRLPHQTDHAKV